MLREWDAMIIDPKEVKDGLKDILADQAHNPKATIREALSLIRQMEGDLRRQGFTEYNDKEDTE
jgi:hypothetical protein